MFNLMDRYIARHVISASLLILFLLIVLRAMFGLLEESNSIGKGSYQLADALLYVGLMLPQKVLELFPMGVLIGSLFGLGILAANNELTVMRAAGMTTWRIAGSTLKASLILMVCVLVLSEIVAPVASKSAQQLRTSALSDGKISRSATGLWAKRDNQIIHIASIHKSGEMHNLAIYQLDQSFQLMSLIEAKSAVVVDDKWYLMEVAETHFDEGRINKILVPQMEWDNPIDEDNIDTLTLKPEMLNISGLVKYHQYLTSNLLDATEIELAIWQKLLLPISVAIMMLLAASFAFGPMRDVSMGARVLTGVMLGFGFHLVKQSFGPISLIYGASPFLGAVLPLIVFAAFAYGLMRKSG
ncbi:MAG: LPS export ABC transporter permease LptG [Kangiellaceae bacterium]|nr:LPS export ABC transporter permease LptG [Kangiellaceae bacterium]